MRAIKVEYLIFNVNETKLKNFSWIFEISDTHHLNLVKITLKNIIFVLLVPNVQI